MQDIETIVNYVSILLIPLTLILFIIIWKDSKTPKFDYDPDEAYKELENEVNNMK